MQRSYDTQKSGMTADILSQVQVQIGTPQIRPSNAPPKWRAIEHCCADEVDAWLRRRGTSALVNMSGTILSVRIMQQMATAERTLIAQEAGKAFFQHYLLQLADQITPAIQRCIERTLDKPVLPLKAQVDHSTCDMLFHFELRSAAEETE